MARFAAHYSLGLIAVIYVLSLSPYVGGGDSGELIVTAANLAAPHPPGYPLYTALAHLFTYIPISTIAWRVGLFSVVCQIAAAGFLYALLVDWTKSRAVAVLVSLFYSLSPLVWRFAIEAEVFALNNFFACALLWLLWRAYQPQGNAKKMVLALSFLLGLAATNHLTILMWALPFSIVFVVHNRAHLAQPQTWIGILAAFGVGLLPYLFLFILGQNRAIYSWGDFSSWEGFFTHVLRREYGTLQLATGGKEDSHYWAKLGFFAKEMALNLGWLGALFLIVAGAKVFPLRKVTFSSRNFALQTFFATVFFAVVFHGLSNLDLAIPLYYHTQSRMWLLPLLGLCLLCAQGVKGLFELLPSYKRLIACGILTAILVNTLLNWRAIDRSRFDFFDQTGRTMLEAVAPGAVILMREDVYVNALRYLQAIENVRPDVHVIPLDALWWPWMKALVEKNVPGFVVPGALFRYQRTHEGDFTLSDLLDANISTFPIYISKISPAEELTLRDKYWGFPYGFHSRVKSRDQGFSLEEVRSETRPFRRLSLPDDRTYKYESWETFIRQNYFQVIFPMANVIFARGAGQSEWTSEAVAVLREAEHKAPELDNQIRQIFNSWGIQK